VDPHKTLDVSERAHRFLRKGELMTPHYGKAVIWCIHGDSSTTAYPGQKSVLDFKISRVGNVGNAHKITQSVVP